MAPSGSPEEELETVVEGERNPTTWAAGSSHHLMLAVDGGFEVKDG